MIERQPLISTDEEPIVETIRYEKSPSNSEEHTIYETNNEVESLYNPTDLQKAIIEFPANPNEILSIRAGPGCGKTSTIIERIIYLVEELDFKPHEILVLSMANRSVDSIKHSLRKRTKNIIYDQLSISTFHSFCSSLEDTYGESYMDNYVKKRIMDDLSWRNFAKLFLTNNAVKGTGNVFLISGSPSLDELIVSIRSGEMSYKEVVDKYKVNEMYLKEIISYLDRNGMVRFPDLITNALNLIDISLNDPDDLTKWISQLANYRAIIVDEFQDMHPLLLKILKKIMIYPTYELEKGNLKHLTIAGDPKQCIYEFLGSNPNLMSQLEVHFPGYKISELFLNQTFRLSPQVLQMCSNMSKNSNNELDTVFSLKPSLYKPILQYFKTDVQEYNFIIEEILRLICESGGLLKPSDFIILARSNFEIENFAKLAENNGIQCNKFSSSSSWVKSKVHILLDIMNVLCKGNGTDFGLLCIIMNLDKRLGNRKRITKLFNINNERIKDVLKADNETLSLEEYILEELKKLDNKAKGFRKSPLFSIYKIPDHRETIETIRILLKRIQEERVNIEQDDSPSSIIESLFRIVENSPLIEYLNFISNKSKKLTTGDIANYKQDLEKDLLEFQASLISSHKEYDNIENTSESFLEFFLRTYDDHIPTLDEESINISTIHTAKGLEFPVVFLAGIKGRDSSLWDSISTNRIYNSWDANKRLFYVASTRAKNLLYISTTENIDNISSSLLNFFTIKTPDLNNSDSFLRSIGQDLRRSVPSKQRLLEGRLFFQELKSQLPHSRLTAYKIHQSRSIHYSSFLRYGSLGFKLTKFCVRIP